MKLVVYMQIFLLIGIFVNGNEWQNIFKMCNHTTVTNSCLRVIRYEQEPFKEFFALSLENAIKRTAPVYVIFCKSYR